MNTKTINVYVQKNSIYFECLYKHSEQFMLQFTKQMQELLNCETMSLVAA